MFSNKLKSQELISQILKHPHHILSTQVNHPLLQTKPNHPQTPPRDGSKRSDLQVAAGRPVTQTLRASTSSYAMRRNPLTLHPSTTTFPHPRMRWEGIPWRFLHPLQRVRIPQRGGSGRSDLPVAAGRLVTQSLRASSFTYAIRRNPLTLPPSPLTCPHPTTGRIETIRSTGHYATWRHAMWSSQITATLNPQTCATEIANNLPRWTQNEATNSRMPSTQN